MAAVAQRTGCLGRLLWLPRLLLPNTAARPAALTAAGLTPAEQAAVTEARQAAGRVKHSLHQHGRIVDAAVLDQVGGSLDRLQEGVETLATQLTEARAWSARHDPEALRHELTALELEEDGPGFVARQQALRALRDRSRLASQLAAELPALSARLRAAAARVSALEARLQLDTLRQDTGAATQHLRALEDQTERELRALKDTIAELRALA